MSLSQRIARDSVPVTIYVVLGRSLGLLAPLCIARWFGASEATDAYFLVLSIPLFTVSLLQTALLSALNPVVARVRLERPASLPVFLGSTMLTCVVALSALSAVLALGVPPLLEALAAGRPETAALATRMLYLLLPVVPIAGVGLVLRSALEVSEAFRIAALVPLSKGVSLLVLVAVLRHPLGTLALPLSYLGAEAIQLLGYGLAAWARGIRAAWAPALPQPLRIALTRLLPLLLGEAAVNMNVVIDKAFAARLGPGELSALEYADRVRVIPETALSAGLLSVVFAHWANRLAAGDEAEVRQSFDRVARWLTLLLAPSLVALWLLRLEVVSLLFQGGRFGPEAAQRTAAVLEGFIPGFLPMMLAVLVVKLLLVRGDVVPVVRAGLVSVCLNTLLDALLVGPLGAPGLSLATSLNQIVVALLLFQALKARTGSTFEPGFGAWLVRRLVLAVVAGAALQAVSSAGMPSVGMRWLLVCGGMGAVLGLEAWRAGRMGSSTRA